VRQDAPANLIVADQCDEPDAHLHCTRRFLPAPGRAYWQAHAITATARKLALLVYRVLRGDIIYSDPGAAAYAQLHRTRIIKALRNRTQQLGLALLNLNTGEILTANDVS
jgi:hypothetical protein